MKISGVKTGNAFVVKMEGRMDAAGAPEVENKCVEWIEKGETNLILDFKKVEYISTTGLRSILMIGKRITAENGKLLLCEMNAMVGEVFRLSGFSSIFSIYGTLDQATETV